MTEITITNEAGSIDVAVAAASGSPLVEVTDLDIAFRRGGATVSALRGVSLSVAPGEIVGLVGESGSGKSVLGLALLGLLESGTSTISGSATVCGTDMVRASPDERRRTRRAHLGAVFQDPMTSLNPTMRVGQQVAEAAGSLHEAELLLGAVGVPDPSRRLRAYPHELSGGLRQRVMIAMAIAGTPSFVIADEPTTALDVTVQSQILELIVDLRDRLGTSFLFITHDLGVAAEVADRIIVLYAGRVAELGGAGAMFASPSHPYTEGLLRSRLLLTTDRSRPIATLPGEPPDPRAHPEGCAFAPRCDRAYDACATAPPLTSIPDPSGPHLAACWAHDRPTPAFAGHDALVPWPAEDSVRGATAMVLSGVEKTFTIRHGLRKEKLHALRGVDLEVRRGEAVALVGESGCGKSTLLRVIAGLQTHDAGGVDIGRGARPQMVFQDAGASLTPWMTIGDLIEERLLEEPLTGAQRRERVAATLALVGLPSEVARAKAAQLSGGQRQRVCLARATVVPPEVLLCDEPTSALDVSLAATVLNLLGRLRRELGIAMIFVTHDLAAARVVADRIAVMYLGRIVDIGTAEEIGHDPIHPYAKALLSTIPGATHRIHLTGDPANALSPPSGCAFHPRCPESEPSCATDDPGLAALDDGPWGRQVACPIALGRRRAHPMPTDASGGR
ncbi:MAG TPA: ABC transporter ATP-binding protein [Acidimicrobiales bacterium]|nr:ABC transporter ATP-binding protein [Acidimicrobiales bacterium]